MPVLPELLAANEGYAATFDTGDLPRRRVAIPTGMDGASTRRSPRGWRLIISQRLLGTEEVVVIHHTDTPIAAWRPATTRVCASGCGSALDFLFFAALTRSVRDDVATIRDSPFIAREVPVFGPIDDVKTGRPQRVV